MRIAVVGGGINGVMTAWRLATLGHKVDLFERGSLMRETSSASTKLLHGGLRYLEQREIRLVYESLHERTWWTRNAPELARPIRLILPIYRKGARPRWLLGAGLTMYDLLAGRHNFGRHRWHSADDLIREIPTLNSEELLGGYSFFDAQMDDYALGLWAAGRAKEAGVKVHERAPVSQVGTDGTLVQEATVHRYDRVVNVAGPWARELLDRSGIAAQHDLDLVRGSHIILSGTLAAGLLVQVPGERRICFILPYQGDTLVGTTEVRQALTTPIVCSEEERSYLLAVYNSYLDDTRSESDVLKSFAGLRPLLRSASDPTRATREYALERHGSLVTVFGGKWTTSRILGRKAAELTLRR